jgi:hypothetical protein
MHWDPKLLLVFAICNGTATGSFARYRGRTFLRWFVFGTLGWFVAIPWLLLGKSQPNDRAAPRGALLQALLSIACAVAVLIADLAFATAKLPQCDYYTNISALNKSVPDSPNGKSAGSQIAIINDIKEISRSENDVHCTGMARLNNLTDVAIDYRFYITDGRLLNETHWK